MNFSDADPRFKCINMATQSLANGINYIIAQCLGAILGAALAYWAMPGESIEIRMPSLRAVKVYP